MVRYGKVRYDMMGGFKEVMSTGTINILENVRILILILILYFRRDHTSLIRQGKKRKDKGEERDGKVAGKHACGSQQLCLPRLA